MRAQVLNAEGRSFEAVQAAQQARNHGRSQDQRCWSFDQHFQDEQHAPGCCMLFHTTLAMLLKDRKYSSCCLSPSACWLLCSPQAVSLCPDWPEAHITLARVQLNLGEPLLALHSYQAAAKLSPTHPDLVRAGMRVTSRVARSCLLSRGPVVIGCYEAAAIGVFNSQIVASLKGSAAC